MLTLYLSISGAPLSSVTPAQLAACATGAAAALNAAAGAPLFDAAGVTCAAAPLAAPPASRRALRQSGGAFAVAVTATASPLSASSAAAVARLAAAPPAAPAFAAALSTAGLPNWVVVSVGTTPPTASAAAVAAAVAAPAAASPPPSLAVSLLPASATEGAAPPPDTARAAALPTAAASSAAAPSSSAAASATTGAAVGATLGGVCCVAVLAAVCIRRRRAAAAWASLDKPEALPPHGRTHSCCLRVNAAAADVDTFEGPWSPGRGGAVSAPLLLPHSLYRTRSDDYSSKAGADVGGSHAVHAGSDLLCAGPFATPADLEGWVARGELSPLPPGSRAASTSPTAPSHARRDSISRYLATMRTSECPGVPDEAALACLETHPLPKKSRKQGLLLYVTTE